MYEFLRGPMLWASVFLFIIGAAFRLNRLINASVPKNRVAIQRNREPLSRPVLIKRRLARALIMRRTMLGTQPFTTVMSLVFHLLVILTPFMVLAHNILLFESFRIRFWSAPEYASFIMAVATLACGGFFLMRRMAIRRVRAVSAIYDYLLFIIAMAPFATGTLAYQQAGNYEIMLYAHMISGELLIAALGMTKLGHMVFFFFARFFVDSEHSFRSGPRAWRIAGRS